MEDITYNYSDTFVSHNKPRTIFSFNEGYISRFPNTFELCCSANVGPFYANTSSPAILILGLEKYSNDLITHYGARLPQRIDGFYHPSLSFLAKYFQDSVRK